MNRCHMFFFKTRLSKTSITSSALIWSFLFMYWFNIFLHSSFLREGKNGTLEWLLPFMYWWNMIFQARKITNGTLKWLLRCVSKFCFVEEPLSQMVHSNARFVIKYLKQITNWESILKFSWWNFIIKMTKEVVTNCLLP